MQFQQQPKLTPLFLRTDFAISCAQKLTGRVEIPERDNSALYFLFRFILHTYHDIFKSVDSEITLHYSKMDSKHFKGVGKRYFNKKAIIPEKSYQTGVPPERRAGHVQPNKVNNVRFNIIIEWQRYKKIYNGSCSEAYVFLGEALIERSFLDVMLGDPSAKEGRRKLYNIIISYYGGYLNKLGTLCKNERAWMKKYECVWKWRVIYLIAFSIFCDCDWITFSFFLSVFLSLCMYLGFFSFVPRMKYLPLHLLFPSSVFSNQ